MALIARIVGLSLLTAGLGAGLGFAFFGQYSDWSGVSPGEAWRLAEEQFQAAGTSPGAVERYFTQWNDYLDKLEWSNR